MRICLFTPTQPERFNNPFLAPCHKRLHAIAASHHIPWILSDVNGLDNAYNAHNERMVDLGVEWVVTVMDDEQPPLDLIEFFQLNNIDGIVSGLTPLLPENSGLPYPKLAPWIFTDNNRVLRSLTTEEQRKPTVKVDTLCTPFAYRPRQLAEAGIRFRDHQYFDGRLGDDARQKGIPLYCKPAAKTKHYSIRTHNIYE